MFNSIVGYDYIMLATVMLTIFVKAVADAQQKKANLTHIYKEKLKHWQLEKLFKVFMIGIPAVGMSLVPKLDLLNVGLFILAYALIYTFWMDRLFNWLTGKNTQYIGKTSLVDITIRRWFKITDDSSKNKSLIVVLKWILFIIGLALMIDFV